MCFHCGLPCIFSSSWQDVQITLYIIHSLPASPLPASTAGTQMRNLTRSRFILPDLLLTIDEYHFSYKYQLSVSSVQHSMINYTNKLTGSLTTLATWETFLIADDLWNMLKYFHIFGIQYGVDKTFCPHYIFMLF